MEVRQILLGLHHYGGELVSAGSDIDADYELGKFLVRGFGIRHVILKMAYLRGLG